MTFNVLIVSKTDHLNCKTDHLCLLFVKLTTVHRFTLLGKYWCHISTNDQDSLKHEKMWQVYCCHHMLKRCKYYNPKKECKRNKQKSHFFLGLQMSTRTSRGKSSTCLIFFILSSLVSNQAQFNLIKVVHIHSVHS